MAYEVTKLVHGRPYRYRVRSERDPVTGKTRNRWTYLGRADAADVPAAVRPRRNARTVLLDALERLLDREDPGTVTAAEISTEAGLAHGTFYRYFHNKQEALIALLERLREERDNELGALDELPASLEQARRTIRAWATSVLRAPIHHRALFRALYMLRSRNPELKEDQRARRAGFVLRLATYLRAAADRGFLQVENADATASVLAGMIDGIFRDTITNVPDAGDTAAAVAVIERAVFGRLG